MTDDDAILRRSGGGRLVLAIDAGAPGDVFVVLDRDGAELGRAVTTASVSAGLVRADFDPPIPLPPRGHLYEIRRLPQEARAC